MATKARASSTQGSKPTRKQRRLDTSPHSRRPRSLPENAREAATPRLTLKRVDLILILTLITVALILFLYRLDAPSVYNQYLLGNPEAFTYYTTPLPPAVMYTWNHPPAGLWLIAAGIKLLGNHSFGWRIASALFGVAGIAVAYLLALHLSRSQVVAVLTSCLLLLSGLYMVQARVAMLDIFVTVFVMSALLAFYHFLTANPQKVRWPLVATGVFIGLGVATKWNAVYPAFFMGLFALYRLYKLLRACQVRIPRPEAISAFNQHLVWIPVAFIVIPIAVYVLAYTGYFHSGHSWDEFVRQQRMMLYYHSHLTATHPYASQWWS